MTAPENPPAVSKAAADHKCFTVSSTAYLRNLSREDMGSAVAVHFQNPPKRTESGMSYGLRFPLLIVANYVEDTDAVAEKVASILNEHWSDA